MNREKRQSASQSLRLSTDQKDVLLAIIDWYKKADQPFLTLGGYAGTGKTTLLSVFRLLLHKARPKLAVAFCAYTGKATRVLELTLKTHHSTFAQDKVSTIHSLMYAPQVDKRGHITSWRKKKTLKADLIIVDEASMVDEDLWHDLVGYDIPILAVGDHGQLPPINGQFNLMKSPQIKLERIHRQAAENPIIHLSMLAREEGKIPIEDYGNGVRKLSRYDSASGQEVEELLQHANELMVLTGYNHTRIKLNQQIRQYRDFIGDSPQPGDKVICLKNNWDVGIYNGMLGIIQSIKPKKDSHGEQHWYQADIDLEEGEIKYSGVISSHQFGEPKTLAEFEGLDYRTLGDLFDFGYTLTVHKAQGSQAPTVLLFEERNKHMDDEAWRRWLYTGVTRAQERLTIVGN